MANNVIKRTWNQNKMVCIEDLSGMAFQSESGGHTFEISGTDDSGTAVSLSGTVEARFLRADNVKVTIAGTISNGKASVTLTSNCYTVPGRFSLTIFVTSNSQKVAVYSAVGNVAVTDGVSSGTVPPLVTDSIQTGSITASGDVTVGGVLDVVQRRCSAYLSNQGWYRAVKMPASYGTVALHIERVYDANPPEVHNIDAVITYSGGVKCDFVNEESKSASQLIDKVRLSVASGFYYLDIHYTGTSANNVVLTFEASLTTLYGTTATQMGLSTVADSPVGETTLTPYDFAANVPDASTGYTCLPDGTLIQWGQNGAYEGATTKETEVTFSKAFVDTNYSVNCVTYIAGTDYSNYDGIVYTVHRDSVSKCKVHQRVVGAGASGNLVRDFMWTAIGRWK